MEMDTLKGITDRLEQPPKIKPGVTLFGDLNFDHLFISPPLEAGKEMIISGTERLFAGAAGYVCSGLTKLGVRAKLCTRIGDDREGRDLIKASKELGINTDAMHIVPGGQSAFTHIYTQLSEKSPRQTACFPGVLNSFAPEEDDYGPLIKETELVYSCNYFIMPKLRERIPEIFARTRREGKLTAYDANAGDGWENPADLKLLRDGILPETDIVFLNEMEAYWLSGEKQVNKSIKTISPESRTVVIKQGPDGAVIRHEGQVFSTMTFPLNAPRKDTIGAGDSFQAAFLCFCLQDFSPAECALLACANASSTVLHHGGTQGQLNRGELARFLEQYELQVNNNHITISFRGK